MTKSSGSRGIYQKKMPITSKNIGKSFKHAYDSPKVDKGEGAAARRLRQMAKQEAKRHGLD